MKNKKPIIIGLSLAISVVGVIVVICLISSYLYTHKAAYSVCGNDITRAEYDYYYNSYYNMYLNDYSAYFDYMGVDSESDLLTQEYEDGMTFKELFDKSTIDQIKQVYVLSMEASQNNFSYDAKADVLSFFDTISDSLSGTSYSVNDYLKKYYGKHANKKRVSEYMERGFLAKAYYESLKESMGDEEAYIYVEDLKDNCEFKEYD